MPLILVDADACPVKDDIYRVAIRHAVPVVVVSNSGMRLPGIIDQDIDRAARCRRSERGSDGVGVCHVCGEAYDFPERRHFPGRRFQR